MSQQAATAEVKASIQVRPGRSQVYLVSVAVVAGISIICGTTLLAFDKPAGWGLIVLPCILLGAGFAAWRTSQSDTDLEHAHPTKFHLPDGTQVTTDSRTLRSPEGLRGLARICDEILCRKPLPKPDGLVDSNATVIPNSKDNAAALVNQINEKTQTATNNVLDALGLSDESKALVQNASGSGNLMAQDIPANNLNLAAPANAKN